VALDLKVLAEQRLGEAHVSDACYLALLGLVVLVREYQA